MSRLPGFPRWPCEYERAVLMDAGPLGPRHEPDKIILLGALAPPGGHVAADARGEGKADQASGPRRARSLRIALVALLLVLTVPGWTGDVVNIFVAPATATTPPPQQDLGGFFAGVQSLGGLLVWHALEGIVALALGIVVLILAFVWVPTRAVRISAVLGLFFLASAAYGGYGFVLSGFSAELGDHGWELHRLLRLLLHHPVLREVKRMGG